MHIKHLKMLNYPSMGSPLIIIFVRLCLQLSELVLDAMAMCLLLLGCFTFTIIGGLDIWPSHLIESLLTFRYLLQRNRARSAVSVRTQHDIRVSLSSLSVEMEPPSSPHSPHHFQLRVDESNSDSTIEQRSFSNKSLYVLSKQRLSDRTVISKDVRTSSSGSLRNRGSKLSVTTSLQRSTDSL